jgi:putative transposase
MFQLFRSAVADARRHGDLCFAALFSQESIEKALGNARWLWQGWVYMPAATMWVFLAQCLSPDHSCSEAVAQLIAWRVTRGLAPCSADSGAYCAARNDLPEEALHALVCSTGRQTESQSPSRWRWHGRNVRVVDGSTVTMPDTPENQAVYPQMKAQMPGCGFPIARILVVFSLSVGAVLEVTIGKYKGKQTGENSLFRQLQRGRPDDAIARLRKALEIDPTSVLARNNLGNLLRSQGRLDEASRNYRRPWTLLQEPCHCIIILRLP